MNEGESRKKATQTVYRNGMYLHRVPSQRIPTYRGRRLGQIALGKVSIMYQLDFHLLEATVKIGIEDWKVLVIHHLTDKIETRQPLGL
jgi:hypothetical protein